MEREDGFYWVYGDPDNGWEVAQYYKGKWCQAGNAYMGYEDSDFLDIDERKIERAE